ERLLQLRVARERQHGAGESRPRLHLDAVHDRGHRTLARDPRPRAPRGEVAAGKEARRHRVEAVKVEEEPAIGAQALEYFTEHRAIDRLEGVHSYPSAWSARHAQRASPRARHDSCTITPSYPATMRNSSPSALAWKRQP